MLRTHDEQQAELDSLDVSLADASHDLETTTRQLARVDPPDPTLRALHERQHLRFAILSQLRAASRRALEKGDRRRARRARWARPLGGRARR